MESLLPLASEIAAFLKERKDGQFKLSLRAGDEKINVAHIAKVFQGGGHTYAAGAVLPGPLKQALQQVLKACHQALK